MSVVVKSVPKIAAELNRKFGFDPMYEDVPDKQDLTRKHRKFWKKVSK